MKYIFPIVFMLFISSNLFAETLSVSCEASKGYSYYFEGGAVPKSKSGFTEDEISGGKITLTLKDKDKGDVLSMDASGVLKSATSQEGVVMVLQAGEGGINWFVMYEDGVIETYSLNVASMKMASYRNTVGNPFVAKNSLFISNCEAI